MEYTNVNLMILEMTKLIEKLYIFNDLHHFKNHTNNFKFMIVMCFCIYHSKCITSNPRSHPGSKEALLFV